MSKQSSTLWSGGYSLVEVLIVLAIFGLVSSGIHTTFNAGQLFAAKQQDVIAIQQQGRLAMMNMERELRTIGYGYADLGNLRINAYPPVGPSPVSWGVADSFDNLSSSTIASKTDSIRFRYSRASADLSPEIYLTQDHPSSAADTFVNSTEGFQQGDLFLIYDPRDSSRAATLLQVSNDPGNGLSPKDKLIHNPGANGPYNPPNASNLFPAGGYTPGAMIVNLRQSRTISYYVDNNLSLIKETRDHPDISLPATSTRPIAAGVEDFQIKYCFKDGQWLDAMVAGDSNHDINNLRALRVSIMVRSLRPVKYSSGTGAPLLLSGLFGNGVSRGGDQYRRVIITTVINLRNLATRG